jgi:hypothetical protein
MSLQPIKTAFKYAGAWSVALAFVTLLTIIFSFLGTLFCAALGGMMMGATKASGKLSVPFSVFCPGVLFALLRFQKSELPQRQVTVLVVICLAAFWAIYLLSALVMAQEQKAGSANRKPMPAPKPELPNATAVIAAPPARLEPKQLEGHWCSETPKRTMDIKDGGLELSTLDADGHVSASTKARVRWIELPEASVFEISAAAGEAEFASPAI